MRIPDTVTRPQDRDIYAAVNVARGLLKGSAESLAELRQITLDVKAGNSETVANITLAYRHLEDASMRLGKALQSIDGGVSVYDKATTVGAPATTPGQCQSCGHVDSSLAQQVAAEGSSGLVTREVGTPRPTQEAGGLLPRD